MCAVCRMQEQVAARAAIYEVAKRANRAAMLGCTIHVIELIASPSGPVGSIAYDAPEAAERPLRFELPGGYPEF